MEFPALNEKQYNFFFKRLHDFLIKEMLLLLYQSLFYIKNKKTLNIDMNKDYSEYLKKFEMLNYKNYLQIMNEEEKEVNKLMSEFGINNSYNLFRLIGCYLIFRISKYLQVKKITFPTDINLFYDFENFLKVFFMNKIDTNWFSKFDEAKNPIEICGLELMRIVKHPVLALQIQFPIIEARLESIMPWCIDKIIEETNKI